MPLPPALLERLKRRKVIQEKNYSGTSLSADALAPSSSASTKELNGSDNGCELELRTENAEPEEEIIAEDYSDEDTKQDSEGDESDGEEDEEEDYDSRLATRPSLDADLKNHDETSRSSDESESGSNNQLIEKPNDNQLHEINREYESVIGCPNKYNIYHVCSQYCRDKYSQPSEDELKPTKKQRKHLALLLKTFPMSNDWTVVYDPGVKTFYFWNIISNHVSWVPPGMGTFASPPADQIRMAYMDANLGSKAHDE